MTWNEAKKRPDYKFSPASENTLRQIRNGCMEFMTKEGDPIWGEAVLEIGYVDIELNITAPCIFDTDKPEDQTPVLEYFCCIKRGNHDDDWYSLGYLDDLISGNPNTKVDVDWTAENWKEQLEKDMFQTLDWLCDVLGFSYDRPNQPSENDCGPDHITHKEETHNG